jgi:hypothetical protein
MEDTKYIQSKDGSVYKVLPNYFLKLSPWKDGEDRRVVEEDLGEYKMIRYENACMIVNSQFRETKEEWSHHGKDFVAYPIKNQDEEERTYFLQALPSHKVILKDAKSILSNNGISVVSMTSDDGVQEFKMIKHKGKIYYILIINEYLPRVQAYNTFGEFCQWVGIHDCKPIYSKTDKRFV